MMRKIFISIAVAADDRMAKQDLDLAVAALLGQRDDPAHALEQVVAADDLQRVEVVDRRAGT